MSLRPALDSHLPEAPYIAMECVCVWVADGVWGLASPCRGCCASYAVISRSDGGVPLCGLVSGGNRWPKDAQQQIGENKVKQTHDKDEMVYKTSMCSWGWSKDSAGQSSLCQPTHNTNNHTRTNTHTWVTADMSPSVEWVAMERFVYFGLMQNGILSSNVSQLRYKAALTNLEKIR